MSQDASSLELFIQALVGPDASGTAYDGPERRAHPRYAKPVQITATPVDEHNRSTGPRLNLMARDISAGGVCLVHHEPIAARRLVLEIGPANGGQMRLVLEVLRARTLDDGSYEVAGKFVNW